MKADSADRTWDPYNPRSDTQLQCFRRSESPQALTRPRVLFFVLASARVTAPRPQSLAPSTSHADSEDERNHMENVVKTTFIKRRAEPSACDSCPRAKTAPPADKEGVRSASQLAEPRANFTSPLSSTAQQQLRTRSQGEERSSPPRRCAAHVFRGSLPGAAGPPPLLQGARSCTAQVAEAEGFSSTSR